MQQQELKHLSSMTQGSAISPDGHEITVDNRSLRRDGMPWLPVMGEFHYARYPQSEWRDALLKMVSGGIDIVATYVFWIYHEEVKDVWDWQDRRDLRAFAMLCAELGLYVVIRLGPWCHGEVRNGGFPDWLVQDGCELRSDDPQYIAYSAQLFEAIAGQTRCLLWKNGGPIIGVQLENEYGGPAEHLLTLKRLALEAGFDVPLYTRTGWPDLSTPIPPGELLPLFGGYPDGFWDRSITEMPRGYRGAFLFTHVRADGAIATDQLGDRTVREDAEDALYPYFACEIGGGMERSYHRRIHIFPRDVAALALVKLGSGNNLQGYYMYHGGTNPEGRLSTLQESQATHYWNDVPVKSYDFQAPLGEFGQVRSHYHELRRLHLFLRDFGSQLATMPSMLPEARPTSADDSEMLRWSSRSDGRSGFVFVNNYQRLQPMPAKHGVRFDLCLADGCVQFPNEPVTIPADSALFWPFGWDLDGIRLRYATAQPISRIDNGGTTYFVFAQSPGVPTEFVLDADATTVENTTGSVTESEGRIAIRNIATGLEVALSMRTPTGQSVCIILLDEDQSLACWKGRLAGRERLFLTRAALMLEDGKMRLRADDPAELAVSVFPALPSPTRAGAQVEGSEHGLFQRFEAPAAPPSSGMVSYEQIRAGGPARQIVNGWEGVAEAPSEADFDQAAVWRLHLSADIDEQRDLRLSIRYVGDVARIILDGRLLTDNFYNGDPFEVGLNRYGPAVYSGELLVMILPLRRDAPIYLPAAAWPLFGDKDSVAGLNGISLIEVYETMLTLNE